VIMAVAVIEAGSDKSDAVGHGGIGEARIDKEGLCGLGAARVGAVDLILLWRLWIGAARQG
jgi:hypothetical protein